ncbi:MAG: bifunctional diaminohydroxyphosphoribosylaminopyrimidine deaminase/5-amino-6-(5-phosphoribosylamino)uracil reductase RibD, partial [Planctomycetales bacterium]|nr:bifunctional diaminohydroxyphosphoribosylaminopyrimidine deaminase/5-amino-6-(5-phosphoribosylamino)uracil reductase RibD [Planctomycetales bacterium]
PPCADALIAAGVRRVVVGCEDPNPQVAGKGLARLAAHGIELLVGVELESAAELIAPFAKLMRKGMPWVIAKWGMTLDGKIAASDGSSQWITNSLARQRVHALRRRVDAVMVGSRTALADNPQLIARPPGPRVTQRVIFDSMARLPVTSQLAQTAGKHPTLLAVSANANPTHLHALRELGVETLVLDEAAPEDRMLSLLAELGRRRVTNLLVEGGGTLLGALFDLQQIDEVYAFVAPRLLGGDCATTPIAGQGAPSIAQMLALKSPQLEIVGDNLAVSGRIRR